MIKATEHRITRDTDTYSWDWSNRLTGAEVDGTDVAFTYLGDSTRQDKTVDSTTTTEYLWDRVSGLPTLLGDGTSSVVHSGAGATEVDDATDDRLFDLTDGLGSVRAQSDDLGAVIGTADFDVWGSEFSSTTSSLFGWTGEQNDDETGLTYLRARYYSPTYGRFLSTDPVQPNAGGTQGFNAYAYAKNNPATLTDPSGMLAGSWEDLPGYNDQKARVDESFRIIGCWHTYRGDMAKIIGCVGGETASKGGGHSQSSVRSGQTIKSAGEAAAWLATLTIVPVMNELLPLTPRMASSSESRFWRTVIAVRLGIET